MKYPTIQTLFRAILCSLMVVTVGSTALAQGTIIDPSFMPARIYKRSATGGQMLGTVNDVVRQPDGKYIVGGDFNQINGIPARNLARLNADGTPDVAFTAACGANRPVFALAVLPNGYILVGGDFDTLAGARRVAIGRLYLTGVLDVAFYTSASSAILPNGYYPTVRQIAVQPSGHVLIRGAFNLRNAGADTQYLARLDGVTGQEDVSFAIPYGTGYSTAINNMVMLPDGRVVVGMMHGWPYGSVPIFNRLLPAGGSDPTFTPIMATHSSGYVYALDAAGRVYYGSAIFSPSTGYVVRSGRLNPDGTIDQSFYWLGQNISFNCITEQPNGRLLMGGSQATGTGSGIAMSRFLSNGALDNSFTSAIGPVSAFTGTNSTTGANTYTGVNKVLVQADGAIVAAGSFFSTGSNIFINGLVRMLDTNVLQMVADKSPAGQPVAWPVPAHDKLHLSLDAVALPQQLVLLDAVGRIVMTKAVSQPEMDVTVSGLSAGVYSLRVHYANGTVTQRLVIE